MVFLKRYRRKRNKYEIHGRMLNTYKLLTKCERRQFLDSRATAGVAETKDQQRRSIRQPNSPNLLYHQFHLRYLCLLYVLNL